MEPATLRSNELYCIGIHDDQETVTVTLEFRSKYVVTIRRALPSNLRRNLRPERLTNGCSRFIFDSKKHNAGILRSFYERFHHSVNLSSLN